MEGMYHPQIFAPTVGRGAAAWPEPEPGSSGNSSSSMISVPTAGHGAADQLDPAAAVVVVVTVALWWWCRVVLPQCQHLHIAYAVTWYFLSLERLLVTNIIIVWGCLATSTTDLPNSICKLHSVLVLTVHLQLFTSAQANTASQLFVQLLHIAGTYLSHLSSNPTAQPRAFSPHLPKSQARCTSHVCHKSSLISAVPSKAQFLQFGPVISSWHPGPRGSKGHLTLIRPHSVASGDYTILPDNGEYKLPQQGVGNLLEQLAGCLWSSCCCRPLLHWEPTLPSQHPSYLLHLCHTLLPCRTHHVLPAPSPNSSGEGWIGNNGKQHLLYGETAEGYRDQWHYGGKRWGTCQGQLCAAAPQWHCGPDLACGQ